MNFCPCYPKLSSPLSLPFPDLSSGDDKLPPSLLTSAQKSMAALARFNLLPMPALEYKRAHFRAIRCSLGPHFAVKDGQTTVKALLQGALKIAKHY